MASKLDGIASEYNHLLVSQLDSQRAYFENLLASADVDAAARLAAAQVWPSPPACFVRSTSLFYLHLS